MQTSHPIGSISHGTLRTEDLLLVFADELTALDKEGEFRKLLHDAETVDADSEEAQGILEELEISLNTFCRPFFYFGTHPEDGSDFGFWVDNRELDGAILGGEVVTGETLLQAALKADIDVVAYLLVINDHGNMTLYNTDGEELWAVV